MAAIRDRIMVITDLLLGAAYSDQNLRGQEEDTVRKLLRELLDGEELPKEVDDRIKTFPAGTFDMKQAATDFTADPPIKKRKLLELVAAIHDADEELDLDEDAYLRDLAKALGMDEDEYKDLALHVEVEELRGSFEELREPEGG